MSHREVPRRVHFITDADRGYTLEEIRTLPGSGIIYSELYQRPTDEQPQPILPAVAIMRTAEDLPTVGQHFCPEIVTDRTRGTCVLKTGRVEIVTEEPPSHLMSSTLRSRADAFMSGGTSASNHSDLRESLAAVVRHAEDKIERRRAWESQRGRPAEVGIVDADLASMPPEWIEDLAAARLIIAEIDAAEARRSL